MITRPPEVAGSLRQPTPPSRPPATVGVLAIIGASLALAAPARAQVAVQLGVIASSNLVRDSLGEAFAVRANPALALGVAAEARVDRYRVGAALSVSRSDVIRHQPDGGFPVTSLTVWNPRIYLRQPLRPWLSGEVGLGLVIHDPADRAGTFFGEDTPVEPGLSLGLRIERPLGGWFAAGLATLYDIHRFSTSRLRAEGFTGQSYVHRVTAALTLRRVASHERAR